MANAAEKQPKEEASKNESKEKAPKRSLLLVITLLINTLAMVAVVYMVMVKKSDSKQQLTMEDIVEGAGEDQERTKESGVSGIIIPLDYFLVNLSGELGHKVFKVKMEFDVDSSEVQNEIDKRMPRIRDIIIILLSSKNYSQVSTPKGKEKLKEEIRDTVNSFLRKGKVNKVLFTEFIYS